MSNGDTLVARITPCLENGKTCLVDFLADGQVGWGSTEYIVLRPRPPLPSTYAYYLARSEVFRTFAIGNMTGTSGRQRVPAESLAQFAMVHPSNGIAQLFGRITADSQCAMKANDDEAGTLATLRNTLLPKLISGELRVKGVERFIVRAI